MADVVVAVDGGGSKTDVVVLDLASGDVLGSARGGNLERILLGATSTSVVALARCPVVVVGPVLPEDGDIVVAFDDSPHSRAALR